MCRHYIIMKCRLHQDVLGHLDLAKKLVWAVFVAIYIEALLGSSVLQVARVQDAASCNGSSLAVVNYAINDYR